MCVRVCIAFFRLRFLQPFLLQSEENQLPRFPSHRCFLTAFFLCKKSLSHYRSHQVVGFRNKSTFSDKHISSVIIWEKNFTSCTKSLCMFLVKEANKQTYSSSEIVIKVPTQGKGNLCFGVDSPCNIHLLSSKYMPQSTW